jgi:uncharacterized protein (TIGR02466 family)
MAVELLFPNYVFHRQLTDENLHERQGVSYEYLQSLKDEMDGMRARDEGRMVSNRNGWQSNDGCESNPRFQKLMNRITRMFDDEVLPFYGFNNGDVSVQIGNSWANINGHMCWNSPHLHNGCWYSGVFYIHADGDEGDIDFIDTDEKVVHDMPPSPMIQMSSHKQPITGKLMLFPSGLMHMVEPNMTQKERYSISFNINYQMNNQIKIGESLTNRYYPWVFDLDQDGYPLNYQDITGHMPPLEPLEDDTIT